MEAVIVQLELVIAVLLQFLRHLLCSVSGAFDLVAGSFKVLLGIVFHLGERLVDLPEVVDSQLHLAFQCLDFVGAGTGLMQQESVLLEVRLLGYIFLESFVLLISDVMALGIVFELPEFLSPVFELLGELHNILLHIQELDLLCEDILDVSFNQLGELVIPVLQV